MNLQKHILAWGALVFHKDCHKDLEAIFVENVMNNSSN